MAGNFVSQPSTRIDGCPSVYIIFIIVFSFIFCSGINIRYIDICVYLYEEI